MATKLGRMVTHRDDLPLIDSHNPLIMCSQDILKSSYLHHHNAYGHKTYWRCNITRGVPSVISHALSMKWWCEVTWQIKKTLYLHLQKTHEHQTSQGASLYWEPPILKVTWPFDNVSNVKSGENFKSFYFHYHKSYGL